MKLKSIKSMRRRLADEVYDQLVDAIMDREISMNDRLIQERLAEKLQISRTPVREALLRLESEGVLETVASGGFKLSVMSEEDVRQIYQARAAIEGQTARILAANGSAAVFEELRALVVREEALENPTARDYFVANRNIHRAFVERAGNKFLLEMFDMIWGRAMAFPLFATIENVDLGKSLGTHLALVESLETGDRSHAIETFTRHIQAGFDLQIEGLRGETGKP